MSRRSLLVTVVLLAAIAVIAGFAALSGDQTAVPRSILAIDGPLTNATTTASPDTSTTVPPATDSTSSNVGASAETAAASPAPAGDGSISLGGLTDGCLTGSEHAPTGDPVVVTGTSEPSGGGTLVRYIVEVEEGLAVDPTCFAHVVESVLSDERSWGGGDRLSFQRVDAGPVDFRISLFSPALTDSECAPLQTNGIFSCWTGSRAAINVWRWQHGTDEYAGSLDVYREYVINHEVGHGLGHGHTGCPVAGEPAPVMQQHTKTLDGCTMNGYPLESER